MSPDLPRGTVNLIGGELDVDDPRLGSNRTLQSLHHCSIGYHPYHTNDLATKAYPCKRNQEHKQEQEMQANNLITRWGLTNQWTATLFGERLNLRKTQTPIWQWLLNKKELGACKSPGRNPNAFQHGTRANGPTDGDIAPWQILDANLCRSFLSTHKEFLGVTGAIGSSMKFWFQPYIERPNLTPYMVRASILVNSGSGIQGWVEVELDMDSSLVSTS
jgi:hypothetical protein